MREDFHRNALGVRKISALSISVVLATTDATNSSLDCTSHALFAIVATANAHGLGTVEVTCTAGAVAARLHLSSAVAGTLVFLEGSFNRERRLALALEVIRMVLLRYVSRCFSGADTK